MNGDQEIRGKGAVPEGFFVDAERIGFQYPGTEFSSIFFWEDVERFFEVRRLDGVRAGK